MQRDRTFGTEQRKKPEEKTQNTIDRREKQPPVWILVEDVLMHHYLDQNDYGQKAGNKGLQIQDTDAFSLEQEPEKMTRV